MTKIYRNIDSIPELARLDPEERLKAHAACGAQYARDRNRHAGRTERLERLIAVGFVACTACPFIIAKLWGSPNAALIAFGCAVVGGGVIGLVIHQLNIRLRRPYYAQYLNSTHE